MAWNQPGGNGNKDPWGDRGNQQGPPDLDEVLKKLQAWLGRTFGGGKPTGGKPTASGGGFSLPGGRGLLLIVLVLLIGWAISGVYIVDPPEQGVVLRFGKYVRSTGPGPHWLPKFIEDVEKVNVQRISQQEIGFRTGAGGSGSVAHESLMLTEDENIVDLKFAVQYRIKEPAAWLFNVLDPDNTLRQATESSVREIVGRNTMDFVLTEGRNAVAVEARELTQEILDNYGTGLLITSVNMQDAQPPKEVQEAFFDAVKAREDEERFKNEARAYREDILPKARGDANAIRQRAEAYKEQVIAASEGETARFLNVLSEYQRAPEVTRERLYLDAIESVMARSSKVLLDAPDTNSLMYLPIDRLLSKGATGALGSASGSAYNPDATLENYGTQGARQRDDARGRTRE
jgi:membrane protease subunit HflK